MLHKFRYVCANGDVYELRPNNMRVEWQPDCSWYQIRWHLQLIFFVTYEHKVNGYSKQHDAWSMSSTRVTYEGYVLK